jgi:hypothetical protein
MSPAPADTSHMLNTSSSRQPTVAVPPHTHRNTRPRSSLSPLRPCSPLACKATCICLPGATNEEANMKKEKPVKSQNSLLFAKIAAALSPRRCCSAPVPRRPPRRAALARSLTPPSPPLPPLSPQTPRRLRRLETQLFPSVCPPTGDLRQGASKKKWGGGKRKVSTQRASSRPPTKRSESTRRT